MKNVRTKKKGYNMVSFDLVNGKSSLTKLSKWLNIERSNFYKIVQKFSKKGFKINIELVELGSLCIANGVDKEMLVNFIKDLNDVVKSDDV